MAKIVEKELSYAIVAGMFEVHRELGFGYVEPIYSRALQKVLRRKGLHVQSELKVPVIFQGELIGVQRIDMLVDGRVLVEIKSTERLAEAGFRQVRSYLTGMQLDLGLLLHFGPSARFYRVLGGYGVKKFSDDSGNSGNSVAQSPVPGEHTPTV
jgi:GxxExxY protein